MHVKRIFVTLNFILLFFYSAFCQENFISKADQLFKEGKFYDAAYYYEKVIETNSLDPYVYIQSAKCHLLVSPRGKSLKYISKAIELSEKPTLEMYYILGRAYHVNNDFDQAIQYYKESDPEKKNVENIKKLTTECLSAKKYFANPISVDIINVGTIINSEHEEYLPYITADHLQLFFTSTRPDKNLSKVNEQLLQEDIYTSKFNNGKWVNPSKIKSLNEQHGHDACVGISEDGQTMFVYKGTNGGDLYTSDLTGSEWSKVKSLPFNTPGFEGAASLSPDGLTLYFIHTSGANDNRDIYTCTRTLGGKWSKPEPLQAINTAFDEESPFIHPDGKTLYFSSKGHSTMGGYDIFKTVKNLDGSWTEPENLGYPINSTADDVSFVLSADGLLGFYSSDKEGGYGKQDIYAIKMNKSSDYALELLKGEIRDEAGKAIEADIMVTDNNTNELIAKFKSNSENGQFLVSLPCGKNYGIHIEKDGFIFHSENAQLECQVGFKEVKKEVKLMLAHSGAKIVLNNIFFDLGKSEIKNESTIELQKLINLLQQNPGIRIEISGYTDNSGDEASNIVLSEMRAKGVMDYIISKGISKTRISAKGYGSAQPVSTNETDEGRQLNRRTEFKIL